MLIPATSDEWHMTGAPFASRPQPPLAIHFAHVRALFTSVGCTDSARMPRDVRTALTRAVIAFSAEVPLDDTRTTGAGLAAAVTRARTCAQPDTRVSSASTKTAPANRVGRRSMRFPQSQ